MCVCVCNVRVWTVCVMCAGGVFVWACVCVCTCEYTHIYIPASIIPWASMAPNLVMFVSCLSVEVFAYLSLNDITCSVWINNNNKQPNESGNWSKVRSSHLN